MQQDVALTIYEMLTENTGAAMMDSGDHYGRNWERNQKKSFDDFMNEPVETFKKSGDYIERNVSIFHYLLSFGLSIDQVCIGFNEINEKANDWECDAEVYGVSKDAWQYLEDCAYDIKIERTFNTYNGDSDLSQILQGSYLKLNGEDYILLQIHGGCDARGGYTNARLFQYDFDDCNFILEYMDQSEILERIEEGYILQSEIN